MSGRHNPGRLSSRYRQQPGHNQQPRRREARPVVLFRSGGSGWVVCSNGGNNCSSTYANGNAYTSSNGTTWTVSTTKQMGFKTYVAPPAGFASSGNLVSSTKDSNPAATATGTWT